MSEKKEDINSLKAKGVTIDWSDPTKQEPMQMGPAEKERVPEIKVNPELWRLCEEASRALLRDKELYQREGHLVRVTERDSGPVIDTLSRATLKVRLSKVADFQQIKDPVKKEWASCKPPQDVVDGVYDQGEWAKLPHLAGLRDAPFLRPDGSVCQKLGYDPQTRFLLRSKTKYPHIPERPTKDDAKLALEGLLYLVCDFPFASPEHKSAWAALVFTLFARAAIPGPCPLFAIDANTRGSGKSRLVDLASILLTGAEAPRSIQTDDEGEMRKRTLATLLDGAPLTLIDNVRGLLGGATLEAVLTSTTFSDRYLTRSENIKLPALTVWTCTGNNLSLTDDLSRRTLPVRLESPLENPESRTDFKIPDLLSYAKTNRAALAAKVLTVWRAWYVAGEPGKGESPLWGSFEAWSSLVLPLFDWLDLPSPMLAHEQLTADDGNKGAVYSFLAELATLAERKKAKDFSARDLLDAAYPTGTYSTEELTQAHRFRASMEDLCGLPSGKQPSAKQIGWALRRYKGRRIHDLRLSGSQDRKGVARWSVDTFAEQQ